MNSKDPDPIGRPEDYSGSRSYAMSGKIMLSAIIILFFVVILMIFLHLYARWYLLRARRRHIRRRNRNRRATMVFFAADPSTAVSVVSTRGLDPTVIKSLPIFNFSESTHKESIECAVCLSEFEENESGRVLPNCNHTFHVDCIDMWFHSHSTCPLCRSLVEPGEIPAVEQVTITIPDLEISDPGSSSGSADTLDGSGSSAQIPPTEDFRIKPMAIQVPRRNLSEFEDDLTRRDSPASNSFRSPMSRMLSFTRMLSRERRSASSPISGAPAPADCCITMTESNNEREGERD